MRRTSSQSPSTIATKRLPAPITSAKEVTPVSYIRVKFFQYSTDGAHPVSSASPKITTNPEHELFVNLNAPIRLLMEYVRNEANIPPNFEFDLFDEMGNLKHTFDVPAQKMASKILLPKAVYFIVIFPKTEQGMSLKPQLLINRGSRINGDYTTRIRRQLQLAARKQYSART